MQLIETEESQNYLDLAKSLAKEFAQTAVERDAQGGTSYLAPGNSNVNSMTKC